VTNVPNNLVDKTLRCRPQKQEALCGFEKCFGVVLCAFLPLLVFSLCPLLILYGLFLGCDLGLLLLSLCLVCFLVRLFTFFALPAAFLEFSPLAMVGD